MNPMQSPNTGVGRSLYTADKPLAPAEPKWPRIGEIERLIKALKQDIGDEYRATDDPEDTQPGMQVTIGASGEDRDDWAYQTGDNSYSGGAYTYPFWGVVHIHRRSNSRAVAREIIVDLNNSYPW